METRGRRQVRKMKEKSNWFQKVGQNQEMGNSGTTWRHKDNKNDRGPPITTLYVPATPNGELARRLQEAEHRFADFQHTGWVKVIEVEPKLRTW